LDETDSKILELLKRNSRTTNSEIAAKVNLTEGAVRNRIKRLVRTRVIKRFTIDTDAPAVEAIVLIKTQTRGSREILRRIRQVSNRLFETAGEYDAAAHLTDENIQNINTKVDHLRRIDGVITTITLMKIAEEQDAKTLIK